LQKQKESEVVVRDRLAEKEVADQEADEHAKAGEVAARKFVKIHVIKEKIKQLRASVEEAEREMAGNEIHASETKENVEKLLTQTAEIERTAAEQAEAKKAQIVRGMEAKVEKVRIVAEEAKSKKKQNALDAARLSERAAVVQAHADEFEADTSQAELHLSLAKSMRNTTAEKFARRPPVEVADMSDLMKEVGDVKARWQEESQKCSGGCTTPVPMERVLAGAERATLEACPLPPGTQRALTLEARPPPPPRPGEPLFDEEGGKALPGSEPPEGGKALPSQRPQMAPSKTGALTDLQAAYYTQMDLDGNGEISREEFYSAQDGQGTLKIQAEDPLQTPPTGRKPSPEDDMTPPLTPPKAVPVPVPTEEPARMKDVFDGRWFKDGTFKAEVIGNKVLIDGHELVVTFPTPTEIKFLQGTLSGRIDDSGTSLYWSNGSEWHKQAGEDMEAAKATARKALTRPLTRPTTSSEAPTRAVMQSPLWMHKPSIGSWCVPLRR
jgi:hypothetical protein